MNEVVVMHAGCGAARAVLPRHPYTWALANNVPSVATKSAIAEPLPGAPDSLFARPAGCSPGPLAGDRCRVEKPELREVEPGRFSACHFADEVAS